MNKSKENVPDITKKAQEIRDNLLPKKSAKIYNKAYEDFVNWQTQNNITSASEDDMLVYFQELSKKYKPSSIWAKYSMIKTCLINQKRINIGNYSQLTTFLSRNSVGHEPDKAFAFTEEEVSKFLNEASDSEYLAVKAALAVGVAGCLRGCELAQIKIDNVHQEITCIRIDVPSTKNHRSKPFTIDGKFYEIFKRYLDQRPENLVDKRVFYHYKNGQYKKTVMGKDFIAGFPNQIARYLNLPKPEKYTGHSFRCTSATFLVNNGGNEVELTRLGGWKSTSVAMEYIRKSRTHQKKLCNLVTKAVNVNEFVSAKNLLFVENTNNNVTPMINVIDKNTNNSSGPTNVLDENIENIDFQNWTDEDFDLSTMSPDDTSRPLTGIRNQNSVAKLNDTLASKNITLNLNNCQVTFNIK